MGHRPKHSQDFSVIFCDFLTPLLCMSMQNNVFLHIKVQYSRKKNKHQVLSCFIFLYTIV